jgi:hypothetical protein
MRVVLVLLVAALTACAGPATRGTGEAASCAAPQVSIAPGDVAPGDSFVVTGRLLFDSCQDTVANGSVPPPPEPLADLTVLLVQGAEHWALADGLAAAPDGTLHVIVTVPDDARLADGAAQIAVGGVGAPVVIARPTSP